MHAGILLKQFSFLAICAAHELNDSMLLYIQKHYAFNSDTITSSGSRLKINKPVCSCHGVL